MEIFFNKKSLVGGLTVILVFIVAAIFVYDLSPANASAGPQVFEIKSGDGFRGTVDNLYSAGLIRSPIATEFYLLLSGRALDLKPGLYKLSGSEWAPQLATALAGSTANETTVTIPEGSNIYQIDSILSNALVIHPGTLVSFNEDLITKGSSTLEGRLFPDTYNFFTDANASSVVEEFLTNFNGKATPLFASDTKDEAQDLILASIVEKEVPDQTDQEIVAGILLKRLKEGIPLDVDATVCYAKLLTMPGAVLATTSPDTINGTCSTLAPSDFKIDSPYNTYRYKGLPPGPIGNPGVSAIQAALNPQSSPYLYYLSDPATGQTIYATTLAQQEANQRKYLSQ